MAEKSVDRAQTIGVEMGVLLKKHASDKGVSALPAPFAVLLTVFFLLAAAGGSAAPHESPGMEEIPPLALSRFTLGGELGLGLRPHADQRVMGPMASLHADLPLFSAQGWGFRSELFTLGFPGSAQTPDDLVLMAGAASILYALDDTPIVPLVGVGPFLGLSLDGNGGDGGDGSDGSDGQGGIKQDLALGFLVNLGLRGPLLDGLKWELGLRFPLALSPPDAYPFQPALALGLAFSPGAFFAEEGQ
jgi:hypothetical protein